MLSCRSESSTDASHHGEWHLDLPSEHVAHLSGVVDQLVHAHPYEVYEHQLGNGPETSRRCTDGRANKRGF